MNRRPILAAAIVALTQACSMHGFGCTDPATDVARVLGVPATTPDAGTVVAVVVDAGPAPIVDSEAAAEAAAGIERSTCAALAGKLARVEPRALDLRGTIVGSQKQIAMVTDSARRSQVVKQGDYIGVHCWRIAFIAPEWTDLEQIPNPKQPKVVRKLRLRLSVARHRRVAAKR